MKRKNKKEEELKKEIKKLRSEVESDFSLYRLFAEDSRKRGMALSVIIPLIKQEDLVDVLSEYYELKEEKRVE